MREKIKNRSWVPWTAAVALAIILMVVAAFTSLPVIFPGVTQAVGITTVQSINVFGSGAPGSEPFIQAQITILVGIVLILVWGPVFWKSGSSVGKTADQIKWYAGLVLVIVGLMCGITGVWHYGFETDAQWKRAAQSRDIDQLRSELAILSNRIMERYWLPDTPPGAGGELSSMSLRKLKQGEPFINSFELRKIGADSTVILYGMAAGKGKNAEFKNFNNQRGRIQRVVKINAAALENDWLKADSLTN